MKRSFLLAALSLLLLTGCHHLEDVQVLNILNEQILRQNECQVNHEQVNELLTQEALIYNELIENGLESFNQEQELVEEGRRIAYDMKSYLQDYQVCISRENLDEIELEEALLSEQAQEVNVELEALISQYIEYDTLLNQYIESLLMLSESQLVMYEELTDTITLSRLEELANKVNLAIDEVKKLENLQKVSLDEFNEQYLNYYETYLK